MIIHLPAVMCQEAAHRRIQEVLRRTAVHLPIQEVRPQKTAHPHHLIAALNNY